MAKKWRTNEMMPVSRRPDHYYRGGLLSMKYSDD